MRRSVEYACLMACLIVSPGSINAQWVATNGPYGGRIRQIAVSESAMLVATEGNGIYRSIDGGASWMQSNSGLSSTYATCIATSGPKVFVGTVTGVFSSTDGGSTWVSASSGISGEVLSIAVVRDTVFVGTNGGVYRSTNDGSSWTLVNTGLTYLRVTSIASNNAGVFAATEGGGVFRSTNGGDSWTDVTTAISGGGKTVYTLTTRDSSVFAGGPAGVFISTDDGTTWTQSVVSTYYTSVWAIAVDSLSIFAGKTDGVCRSTDQGQTWNQTGFTSSGVFSLVFVGPALFAGTTSGMYRSTDNGSTWVGTNTGLASSSVWEIVTLGPYVFAGTIGSGVYRSMDLGGTWEAVSDGLTTLSIRSLSVHGTDIYAGALGGEGIFVTRDSGSHWTRIPVSGGYDVRAVDVCDSIIHVATSSGMLRSTNYGASWSRITSTITYSFWRTAASILVGASPNALRSTDGGATWLDYTTNLNPFVTNFKCFAGDSSTVFSTAGSYVFSSTDNCSTWTRLDYPSMEGGTTSLALAGSALIAGLETGVFVSSRDYSGWAAFSDGFMGSKSVRSIVVVDTTILAGTEGGVWRRPLSDVPEVHPVLISDRRVLDFGWVFTGEGTRDSFLVTNSGNVQLGIRMTSTNTRFGILQDSVTVPVSTSRYVVVAYSSGWQSEGQSGYLILTHNGPTSPDTLTLIGRSFDRAVFVGSTLDLDLGYTLPGDPKTDTVSVRNSGTQPLSVTVTSTNPRFDCTPGTATIDTTASKSFTISFTPDSLPGYQTGYLIFVHNAPSSPDSILVFARTARGPVFGCDKNEINYGSIAAGDSKQDSITIVNSGDMHLNISAQSTNAMFRISPSSATIDTSSSQTFIVSVQARTVVGPTSGYVVITHNGGSSPDSISVQALIVTEVESKALLPTEFSLDQNFPNPFNPATVIAYGLPARSRVRVKVYSILGENVSILIDQEQAAGFKEVTWIPRGVSTGLYFYRIEAVALDDSRRVFVQVRKMVLLR